LSSILLLIVFPGTDYLHEHNFDEASRYYQLYSSIAPSRDSYFGAAICALIDNRLDESIELFESAQYKKPELFYYCGVAYYRLGVNDKSAHYFRNIYGVKGPLWRTHYYLGLIELRQNRIEKVMSYFDSIPESVDKMQLADYVRDYNLLTHAQEKFIEGQYDEAIDLYREIKHFFGYREIGYALSLAQKGEYEKSIVLLDSVIQYSNDTRLVSRSILEAAQVCLSSKMISKTRQYLQMLLKIESNDKARFLLGKTYSDDAQYDSAYIHFKDLPDSVDEYLFYKGRTDYFLGQWGRAELSLLRHREDFPDSKYGDRTIYILASIDFKRKEYHHAVDFWNDLVSLYPHSTYASAAQQGIGDAYFTTGEYEKALNAYRMVHHYRPTSQLESRVTLRIYETLYHLKKYPSLIYALRRFVEENPQSELVPTTRMRIAKILFGRKEYHQSLAELDGVIEDYSDASIVNKAFIEKAMVYQTIGDRREVKMVFKQLLARKDASGHHSYAAHELGGIYFDEANYDSALHFYNLLLDDEDYREKAIFEIAKIYDILGQNEESDMMINKLISEFPASVFLFDAYILKARAHKNQGYYEEAINSLNELIKKVGKKPEIYVEIGNVYFEMEDYLNARENYLIACDYFKQKRDEAARTLLLAGDASMAIGDRNAARDYYLQAHLIAESLSLKDQATAKIHTIGEE